MNSTIEPNMTISQIFYAIYMGKKNNDAKVTLHVRNGVRYLCVHKRYFDAFENVINYLREDARSIVAPENRESELAVAI